MPVQPPASAALCTAQRRHDQSQQASTGENRCALGRKRGLACRLRDYPRPSAARESPWVVERTSAYGGRYPTALALQPVRQAPNLSKSRVSRVFPGTAVDLRVLKM